MTTSPTPQDGEGLVTDEMVRDGVVAFYRADAPSTQMDLALRAALAAAAPAIAAATRRECADQLRADLAAAGSGYDLTERLHARANTWTGQ